jgi:hypothetical protein
MDYQVGQPVKWAGRKQNAYFKEFGPKMGKPVKRGIVTEVHGKHVVDVWWECCDRPYYTRTCEVKPCVGWSDRSEEN